MNAWTGGISLIHASLQGALWLWTVRVLLVLSIAAQDHEVWDLAARILPRSLGLAGIAGIAELLASKAGRGSDLRAVLYGLGVPMSLFAALCVGGVLLAALPDRGWLALQAAVLWLALLGAAGHGLVEAWITPMVDDGATSPTPLMGSPRKPGTTQDRSVG